MSFYKEIASFADYIHSIRKLENYLSFDLQFPSKWSLPKSMVDESQVVPFEAKDPNFKGISFVSEMNETSINSTLTKVLKIIKLNKEREIKEKLFKQTIDHLKETFEKNDLDKLKKLYFDFETEETELTINDEPESGEDTELVEQ
jgi:hypothetical protein